MTEINKTNLVNTNSPRDSRVYADGEYVVKMPVDTNPALVKVWAERQKHAKNTVDRILEKQEDHSYFVPKTIEISIQDKPYVREERVSGHPLTMEYFSGLSPAQKEIIYKALAQFTSDMNQTLPTLDILSQLQSQNGKDLSFFDVLKTLKPVLTDKEISIIDNACGLLEEYPERTPSFVFFHGDMNENNIFFDEETNRVSVIDFTEARYESAYYMFNSDLSRLPWLDVKKLIEIYNKIPKKQPVRTSQDKYMIDVFNCLRTIQSTGNSLLKNPKNAEIYKRILKETITALQKAYIVALNNINISKTAGYTR